MAAPFVAVVVAVALSIAPSIKMLIRQTLQGVLPLFDGDTGAVVARKLGLVAGGYDETPPVLPISADIFGDDPILWSDWKSCFVRHLKDLCVVVKGDDLPTVGTFV